jgi:flavodoxin
MNICIVVYSITGHTLSVATKLQEKLTAAGHAVTMERLETTGPAGLSGEHSPLKNRPAVDAYDGLVFGSPVRGGTLPPPVASYLNQLTSLDGKQVACLVTGFFPVAGWGREQVIAQMSQICTSKGATICATGSVGWFSLNRRKQISQVVDQLSEAFSETS